MAPKAKPARTSARKTTKKPAARRAPAAAPPPAPAARSGHDLRLGDDLPTTPRGEALNLIVARSHIVAGKILLDTAAPPAVRAQRGQKIQVKHVYRLEENSADKEEYRFLLRSSLGGREHPPSLARHGDVYAMPEDVGGYLVHEFTATGSGVQTLAFEVGVEYVVGDWKQTVVKHHDQKQVKGEIRVTVV